MPTATRTGAALVVALLGTTAVQADVTASQVWQDWQDMFSAYGEDTLSVGSEDMTDGTLTVSDVTFRASEDESSVTAELGDIVFAEQGDGSVAVTLSESVPITAVSEEDGSTVNMTLGQEGVEIVVSGTPEEMIYDLAADRYVLTVDSIEGPDAPEINAMSFTLADISGRYVVSEAELRQIDYQLDAGQVNMIVDVADTAQDGGSFKLLGTINDLSSEADLAMPPEMDSESPDAAFRNGLAIDVSYELGSSDYAFTFADASGAGEGTASAQGGRMHIEMDANGVSYSGGAQQPALSVTAPDLPIPVELSMSEYSYGLEMPLAATEAVQDFGFELLLSELTLNDAVWSMFDPGGMLPRDPATVAVDLSGTGRLLFDVMDEEQAEAMMMADLPGELQTLTLDELRVSAVGAEVTGEGGFEFDNQDLETFDGFPRPEGSVTVRVDGANRLIDTLIEMGLIAEEDAMGARMMMGMFGRTVGDDQIESTLEVTDEGHVIANGQRIQ